VALPPPTAAAVSARGRLPSPSIDLPCGSPAASPGPKATCGSVHELMHPLPPPPSMPPPLVSDAVAGAASAAAELGRLRSQCWAQPQDSTSLWCLAQMQQSMGEAEEFVVFARALCSASPGAWRAVAHVLHKGLGRTADATSLLVELWRGLRQTSAAAASSPAAGAAAVAPGSKVAAEVCCYLAWLQPGQAAHWHRQALDANPCCTTALIGSAETHRRENRFGEAARFYKAALSHRALPAKDLYRLGEALVQEGHSAEGREFLERVARQGDATYQAHATSMLSLSHVMDQNHEEALEYSRTAEDLHSRVGSRSSEDIKIARILRSLTQLRTGSLDQCVATASSIEPARPSGASPWDEMLRSTLGLAETLRGNLAEAEQHFAAARGFAGGSPWPDLLANAALSKHVQGDDEAADALLNEALGADRNSPMALLRFGQFLLCRGDIDRSIQFLQKCLLQPAGSLTYGRAEKGMSHLYLCIAHHLRTCGTVKSDVSHLDPTARDHFRESSNLSPDLRWACKRWGSCTSRAGQEGVSLLVSGSPPRIGMVCLELDHARIVLRYAEDHGTVPDGTLGRISAAPAVRAHTPLASGVSPHAAWKQTSSTNLNCSVPTLLGTGSTMEPVSLGMSRGTSEVALCPDEASGPPGPQPGQESADLSVNLPADKLLDFADLDLGEVMSRGESSIVCRGRLRSSRREIVVKMLHDDGCVADESAARELKAEIATIAGLTHPRLVTFVGACLESSCVALVTDLALGGNLHHALHVRKRQFSRQERFQLATELLEGVRYLHARQPPIAHLDLKSMNLVLDSEGQHLQICDFGLSRAIVVEQEDDEATGHRAAALDPSCGGGGSREAHKGASAAVRRSCGGSPRYMAPECHDSTLGPVTEKADIWSSGCVLIELYGAVQPYAECSNVQQIINEMLVHHQGPSIPKVVEAPVRSVIASMLTFNASERLTAAQGLLQLQAAASSAENRSRFTWIP